MTMGRLPRDASFYNLDVANVLSLGNYGTVTQATSISTGVTLNTKRGAITTVDPALAAAAEAEFIVTDSECHSGNVVLVAVASGPSDNEHVICAITAVAEGSFSILLTNLAAANQADGAMVINFAIL